MAVDNPRWGYTRIRGALSNLGHTIARTTVKRILHDHGVDPAPERSRHMPWKTFLQAHWEGLAACDLFTVEVWVANYYSARNPLRLSSLVILGVVARMFRCATRSSCWCT